LASGVNDLYVQGLGLVSAEERAIMDAIAAVDSSIQNMSVPMPVQQPVSMMGAAAGGFAPQTFSGEGEAATATEGQSVMHGETPDAPRERTEREDAP
jgi:hypothetical protein